MIVNLDTYSFVLTNCYSHAYYHISLINCYCGVFDQISITGKHFLSVLVRTPLYSLELTAQFSSSYFFCPYSFIESFHFVLTISIVSLEFILVSVIDVSNKSCMFWTFDIFVGDKVINILMAK